MELIEAYLHEHRVVNPHLKEFLQSIKTNNPSSRLLEMKKPKRHAINIHSVIGRGQNKRSYTLEQYLEAAVYRAMFKEFENSLEPLKWSD